MNRTFFTSYAYPKLYSNELDCWWIIEAEQHERIKITAFDFLTESCCDILWVRLELINSFNQKYKLKH